MPPNGEEAAGKLPKKRGRKRTADEIRDLILRMAKDSDWGYRRTWGELKKMRINLSRSTVARILKENGFDPGPKRGAGTWSEFVRRHLLDCYLGYYHRFRPHQGIGNVPPEPAHRPTLSMEDARIGRVVCHEHLGGLLKHCERIAA